MLKGSDQRAQHMVEMVRIATLAAIELMGNLVQIDADAVELREELRIGEATPGRDLARHRTAAHQLRH